MKMKQLILFILVLFVSPIFGQDGLSPLRTNPSLYNSTEKVKSLEGSFDSTIVYITDTLTLPFFDDFSRDKFQKYNAQIGVDTMTDSLFYRMLNENDSTPLPPNSAFTSTKTFLSTYNPTTDTTIIKYFDSTRFLFDRLASFPVDYQKKYGYPTYSIFDTLIPGNSADTIPVEDIQFIQDSARIFFYTIHDTASLWLNNQAYHNYRYAINPRSLGVVTFDGLNANGYPYNFASPSNAYADTLMAKPLDLSANSPADSVYFSFLYQEGGFGDAPEEKDSLFVGFYSPVTKTWTRVWRIGGGGVTNTFQVAHIPVTNPDYFQKGFQFRFMNYGSVAGNLDNFHIDYVTMKAMSGYQDTLFKDFAIVYPIATLLKDYTRVPWKDYKTLTQPEKKMSDSVAVSVHNGSQLPENNQNGTVNIYYKHQPQSSFLLNASKLSGGDINYAPRTTYTSYHDFSTQGYSFDTSVNDTSAIFDYEGIVAAQFPNTPINDTTFGKQIFENCYAYDDGTAEKAYGVTGAQGLLAVKFNAYQPDTLVGIKIYFVPSVNDVSDNLFLLTIWNDNNGHPGDTIYQDKFLQSKQPIYTDGVNKFHTYLFRNKEKVVVGETYYVGMRQIDEKRLNIGYDMNLDNSDKIFWSVDGGGNWYNSNYPGSVMIRPVVSSKMDYFLGVKDEVLQNSSYDFTLYPNPAHTTFQIRSTTSSIKDSYIIRSISGQIIKKVSSTNTISVNHLDAGIYFVTRIVEGHPIKTKKLVVY